MSEDARPALKEVAEDFGTLIMGVESALERIEALLARAKARHAELMAAIEGSDPNV